MGKDWPTAKWSDNTNVIVLRIVSALFAVLTTRLFCALKFLFLIKSEELVSEPS